MRRDWKVLFAMLAIFCGVPWSSVSGISKSTSASVGGKVTLVRGDHTVPVGGARLEVRNISDDEEKHEVLTDKDGTYRIAVAPGTYRMSLTWMGGDCSRIQRAPFELGASEHLNFDFLVLPCPISDLATGNLPFEQPKLQSYVKSQTLMNVPLSKQDEEYQEQLIPPEGDHRPEIVISFGKYDNQSDKIRYFPLHQVIIDRTTLKTAPALLVLPVTVTVDRYTLQALNVTFDKKQMVFEAKGGVSVSDGVHRRTGQAALLYFSAGIPKVDVRR